jgi:GAF domain-containing protein
VPATSLERALETVRAQTSVRALLRSTCEELVELLDGSACAISRVVGDLLVGLEEYARTNEPLELGHEYLISDFPLTQEVVEGGEPRLVSLLDEQPDPDEAALLERFGFESLLMVCLPSGGGCWGLVEIYARGHRFDQDGARLAEELAACAGERLEQLAHDRFG